MMPRGSDSSADRMVAVPARALLLGRDHTTRGTTVVLGARRCAVGIARGWEPKPYAYVHPNEDAVAVFEDFVQTVQGRPYIAEIKRPTKPSS